jgi:hypothetical protein
LTTEPPLQRPFWLDERNVALLSHKLTVPLQLQLDSVSDGLKKEYRQLLGSLREDLLSLKMETSGFHGKLDQRFEQAMQTLLNVAKDNSTVNTSLENYLDVTDHPFKLINWFYSGNWFYIFLFKNFEKLHIYCFISNKVSF